MERTKVNNWMGTGFAYSHQPGVTGIPDYADGTDPPGAGNWYFTSNNQPDAASGDVRDPNIIFQDIDVSTGASAALIASGEGAIRLQADMSSYLNDFDQGRVQVDFLSAGGATLGSTGIRDLDAGPKNVWSLNTGKSGMPFNTAKLRVSLFGDANTNGADGYIDNVDVQVTSGLDEVVYLEVNTTNGQATIKNQSGQPIKMDYYEITSSGSALNKAGWLGLQNGNVAGFPAGNGSGNGWEKAGGASDKALGESFLTGKSQVSNGATVPLGAAFKVGGATISCCVTQLSHSSIKRLRPTSTLTAMSMERISCHGKKALEKQAQRIRR